MSLWTFEEGKTEILAGSAGRTDKLRGQPVSVVFRVCGNPYFIDLDTLVKEGLLTQDEINACYWGDNPTQVAYDAVFWYRFPLLKSVCEK